MLLQDTVNQLLEQYAVHLIRTEQHQLIPLYACHMRRDVRRVLYAAYLHRLTKRSMDECWSAYQYAQRRFVQFSRGDIQGDTELADIAEQVGLLQQSMTCYNHECSIRQSRDILRRTWNANSVASR